MFVDEEDIPMVHEDKEGDGCDNYNTLNARKIDETSFKSRQKVKRDKINALYRHLNVTGDIDLHDLKRFRLTKG